MTKTCYLSVFHIILFRAFLGVFCVVPQWKCVIIWSQRRYPHSCGFAKSTQEFHPRIEPGTYSTLRCRQGLHTLRLLHLCISPILRAVHVLSSTSYISIQSQHKRKLYLSTNCCVTLAASHVTGRLTCTCQSR
jgi:hypothetical protein